MSGEKEWQKKLVQKKLGQAVLCGTWRCVDLGRRDRHHLFWGKHQVKEAFTLPRSENMAQGMAILGHCNTIKMSELMGNTSIVPWCGHLAGSPSPAELSVPLGFIAQFAAHVGIQHMATMHWKRKSFPKITPGIAPLYLAQAALLPLLPGTRGTQPSGTRRRFWFCTHHSDVPCLCWAGNKQRLH